MKLSDLKPCLIGTDDGYLVMGKTEGVEREGLEGLLIVYVAWDDLPDDYKRDLPAGEGIPYVKVYMRSESVVVE